MEMQLVVYDTHLSAVDWEGLKQDLIADEFHNGRTTTQLRKSFENSQAVAMAFESDRCIGNGRLLSDGICNAYVIDVWTHSDYRLQGIARQVMKLLIDAVPGQHIYLQTDDAVGLYEKLGFAEQPKGMSRISGEWLINDSRDSAS